MLKGLKKNGVFLLNSIWSAEETKNHLPDQVKKYLAENNINFYIIDATKIAEELGLGSRTNTIMQSAFFKVSGVIPYEQAVEQMKKFIVKSYGNKGEDVVKMNYAAVDRGSDVEKVEVPAEWAKIEVKPATHPNNVPDFIRNVVPLGSPALTHAQLLKRTYGDEIAVVFAGPCIAKKNESDRHPELIDAALTFEELKYWIKEQFIDIQQLEAGRENGFVPEGAYEGALYPIEGGMQYPQPRQKLPASSLRSFPIIDLISLVITGVCVWNVINSSSSLSL